MKPDPLDRAKARLKLWLGDARFLAFGEVAAGQTESEVEEQRFHLVSFYQHRIVNQFRQVDGFNFILDNHFLKSHAYNLALVHLFHRSADAVSRGAAFRHNYKKFFAECVLDERNCMIGRALLIETLVYEQDLMQSVFDRVADDPALRTMADELADLMTQLLSRHELAHYFVHRSSDMFVDEARSQFRGALGVASDRCAAGEREELLCDGVSAWLAFTDKPGSAVAHHDPTTRLRMIAFGFLCFADLASLQRSALATAAASIADDATIQLGSEIRNKRAFSFAIGRDAAMDRRVAAVIELLEGEARDLGTSLYGNDGAFPLSEQTRLELRSAFEGFMDESPEPAGMTGTDLRRRGFAQLLGEALHDHDRGAEHLLWRSKRFSVAGQPVDP